MAKFSKEKLVGPAGWGKGPYGKKGNYADDGGFIKGKDWTYGPKPAGSGDKIGAGREEEVNKDDDETGYEHMKEDHNEEGKMAKHDAMECASDAKDVSEMIQDGMDLPEWLEAKITLAADYMNTVKDYIQHHIKMENVEEPIMNEARNLASGLKNPARSPEEAINNLKIHAHGVKTAYGDKGAKDFAKEITKVAKDIVKLDTEAFAKLVESINEEKMHTDFIRPIAAAKILTQWYNGNKTSDETAKELLKLMKKVKASHPYEDGAWKGQISKLLKMKSPDGKRGSGSLFAWFTDIDTDHHHELPGYDKADKSIRKELFESVNEGAFWRIPQPIAAKELYELTRLIKSINDRLSTGQDINPKDLDRAVKLLNVVKKSAKKFNSKEEVEGTIYEGKGVTQDMWDKDWRITKKYGKEFDENFQKRVDAANSVARNDDQAQDWAFKNWKQLPKGALKMFVEELVRETFSDNSAESRDKIKKTSEVLGMELVGDLEEPSFNLQETKVIRFFNEYIKKQGEKWVVQSKAGKTLGTHDTKKAAIKQLAAIEASKNKKSS